MTRPQPELIELYRAGLKGAVEWMKASLENPERLQNQQLTALPVQTRIAGAQMVRIVGYWASLYENQLAAYSNAAAQTLESARQADATTRAAINAARRETRAAR